MFDELHGGWRGWGVGPLGGDPLDSPTMTPTSCPSLSHSVRSSRMGSIRRLGSLGRSGSVKYDRGEGIPASPGDEDESMNNNEELHNGKANVTNKFYKKDFWADWIERNHPPGKHFPENEHDEYQSPVIPTDPLDDTIGGESELISRPLGEVQTPEIAVCSLNDEVRLESLPPPCSAYKRRTKATRRGASAPNRPITVRQPVSVAKSSESARHRRPKEMMPAQRGRVTKKKEEKDVRQSRSAAAPFTRGRQDSPMRRLIRPQSPSKLVSTSAPVALRQVALPHRSHQVSPPPSTHRARRPPPTSKPVVFSNSENLPIMLTILLQGPIGLTNTLRYMASEGAGWASTYINDGAIPVSETRRFTYDPISRQLRDQNGVGGTLCNEDLHSTLFDLVTFAEAVNIPHNIRLAGRKGNDNSSKRSTSPRAGSPRSNTAFDQFTHWLKGDAEGEKMWDICHKDFCIEYERLSLVHESDVCRNAIGKDEFSFGSGSVEYNMRVTQGDKGFSFGICREGIYLNADVTQMGDVWTYTSRGEIWKCGKEVVGAEPYGYGDVVTVHLNMDKGTVAWSLNGVRQVAFFTQITGTVRLLVSMTELDYSVDVTKVDGKKPEYFKNVTQASDASVRSPSASTFKLPLTNLGDLSDDRNSPRRSRSVSTSKAGISTSLKCGTGTLVGPVDLYIPAGALAVVEGDERETKGGGKETVVVKVSRIKPTWTPANPLCADASEPTRPLSPRIRDVYRSGHIML
eukprot:TRINITY_DN12427_c0_g1_i2.p1 TRINITY_DN12427_c0_g1~~TRINITY_DN12427_c0_g1_i2.p1  ORF type:complete len:754 (+),score=101.11 TRINITY_DN12427_c0_g1_i2:34-2262(+)